MSEHYDFHYQPTGSGAISGQQVLQQTEDAINELGDYVNDNVGGAMDVAQQALETAQNAEQDAQTALDTANSFSDAIQSAQQDASTALSTAQTAQTTASNANNTAIQAQQDASSAVTTANNASGQVSTLSGTVTALGQRVTTAEGNIGQNTSDITALTTRVGTAEGNITTLQNDVSIAQGNASSAMATAGTVKQQAFVFRYSSTALVASSTNSNSLLDNTDNLKVGDKVIDSSGVLFSITAIDTANSTFTIGTALIDLAQDSDVVHKSGNETVGGIKSFSDDTFIKSLNFTNEVASTSSSSSAIMPIITTVTYTDQTASKSARINLIITASGDKSLYPHENNQYALGLTSRKWSEVHATTYYYGSSDIEFSTKFITTDTAQSSISGSKVWTGRQDWAVNCCRIISNAFEKGETPSSDTNRNDYYILKNGSTSYASALGVLGGGISSTNVVTMRLQAIKNASNSTSIANIAIKYNSTTDEKTLETNGDFIPTDNASQNIGNSTSKWATLNGLEPSALGMPDLNNGIDISSYFDATQISTNTYTASADGYISLAISSPNRGSINAVIGSDFWATTAYGAVNPNDGNSFLQCMCVPILKNQTITVYLRTTGGTLENAKFYPCLGNV